MRECVILIVHVIVTPGPTGTAGWPPLRCRRIRAGPVAIVGPQSRAQACAQPVRGRSDHRWVVYSFMHRARVLRSAIVLKPSTLLHLHSVLRKRKYRLLFSSKRSHRPGPKGPKKELIDAVIAMKRRNP